MNRRQSTLADTITIHAQRDVDVDGVRTVVDEHRQIAPKDIVDFDEVIGHHDGEKPGARVAMTIGELLGDHAAKFVKAKAEPKAEDVADVAASDTTKKTGRDTAAKK
jgi:hypothetical protein